jgi:hypothetical protein
MSPEGLHSALLAFSALRRAIAVLRDHDWLSGKVWCNVSNACPVCGCCRRAKCRSTRWSRGSPLRWLRRARESPAMSGRRRSIGGLDQAAWLRPAFVSQIVGVRDRIKELVLSSVRASSHRKIRIERSPLTKTLHQSTAARYSIDLGAAAQC